MNRILMAIYILRNRIMSFQNRQSIKIDKSATWVLSLLHLSKRVTPKNKAFSDACVEGFNYYYGEMYVGAVIYLYSQAAVNFVAICVGLSVDTTCNLWFLGFIPVVYVVFFLFTDSKVEQWNAIIDNYIKKHGKTKINRITFVCILFSIPIFLLSLHLLSIYGNP